MSDVNWLGSISKVCGRFFWVRHENFAFPWHGYYA